MRAMTSQYSTRLSRLSTARCPSAREARYGRLRSQRHRSFAGRAQYPSNCRVRSNDVDFDSEELVQFEAYGNLVEERRLCPEPHPEVEVRSLQVNPSRHRPYYLWVRGMVTLDQ